MNSFNQLNFTNSFASLPETFYSHVTPSLLKNSHLVAFNNTAASLLDLDNDDQNRESLLPFLSGERVQKDSKPIAMLYSGHQFGGYSPQLGDGRAMMLGEVTNKSGEKWELQLKGSGQTPYSRGADGRAVLRSTIREYLCSEAMHALGIPTTRALSITGSDEEVYRESIEKGAMLLRMAPSHVRFGSFEIFYHRQQYQEIQTLANYIIEHHYPQLLDITEPNERYLALFEAVMTRTARMISQWQQVGFSHGVMNTDNMSILGLTLDYGPYGFMDEYDAGYICNHSDTYGRYAFDQQPKIGKWNLGRLAQAMLPLFDETPKIAAEKVNALLPKYDEIFQQHYLNGMRAKLGLTDAHDDDESIIDELLEMMQQSHVDFTNLFRSLSQFDPHDLENNHLLRDQFVDRERFDLWAKFYALRIVTEARDKSERKLSMEKVNPKYVLRNHLVQRAIELAEAGDYTEIHRLHEILNHPFSEQTLPSYYATPPPEESERIVVSCSS
ncbi:MAG: YdiU family protein [Chromatiales bacterium]|nr:YdiU family protein [Chromatiales bacterium]